MRRAKNLLSKKIQKPAEISWKSRPKAETPDTPEAVSPDGDAGETAQEGDVEVRGKKPPKGVTLETVDAYVNGAKTGPADHRQDRLVEAYRFLRHAAKAEGWHRVPGLRDFTTKTGYENPYIPAEVRKREAETRLAPARPREFVPNWKQAGYATRKVVIDPQDFIATLKSEEKVAAAFAKNNLHDGNYFFTKYAEWHYSIMVARESGAERIVDLGAAYAGFANVFRKMFPESEVCMVDIAFAPELKQVAPGIFSYGTDAGDLSFFEDESVDLIVAHNAFEHFMGQSDINCIREVERVLAPGGRFVISPFFGTSVHSITLNPFAGFVANGDTDYMTPVLEEVEEEKAGIDFNFSIISPYARRYSVDSTRSRLLETAPKLQPAVCEFSFDDEGFEDSGFYKEEIFGMELAQSVFQQRVFFSMEFTKQG